MANACKILFTGDVCFTYMKGTVGPADFPAMAEELKPFFDDVDLRVMNLEMPLAPQGVGAPIRKSGPNLLGNPDDVEFFRELRCDCAAMANNHTKDYDEAGLFSTMEILDKAGIAHIGAGKNIAEAYKAWRVEVNGIKVSILSICENEFGVADTDVSGSAGFRMELAAEAIQEEKQVSDYVVIVFHGGCETNPLPSPLCRERYRLLIKLGADALIGGHTHCIQGYEYYKGKPIVYSMGNFAFLKEGANAPWRHGYMAELTITQGEGLTVRPIPFMVSEDGRKMHALTGEKLDKIMAYIEQLSAVIPDYELLRKYYKGWCTISGRGYIKRVVVDESLMDDSVREKTVEPAVKNLINCEAHNELMRTTINMAFHGEFPEYYAWGEKLLKLREIPE